MKETLEEIYRALADNTECIGIGYEEKMLSVISYVKELEKQDKIDFLVWLKENRWHVYKNGMWFTSTDQPYINGEPRKTYTEEQVIRKYNAEMANNVPYRVQNEAN